MYFRALPAYLLAYLTLQFHEFVKVIFWDRVLHAVNPVLSLIYTYVIDWILPAGFLVLAVYFSIKPENRRAIFRLVNEKMNWYFAIASVLTVCAVVSWLLFFVDRMRGPIIFSWGNNSPISINRSGDTYASTQFIVQGFNRSEEPITNIKTTMRSNMTGDIFPMLFASNKGDQPAEKIIIPAGEEFTLRAYFRDDQQSISPEEVLGRFGKLTFSFSYEGGKPYVKNFSQEEVRSLVEKQIQQQKEFERNSPLRRGLGPHVIVKD